MKANVVRAWCFGLLLAVPSLAAAAEPSVAVAAKQQDKAALRSLLKQRADVNAPLPDGATALHWAAHWDDMETVDLLLAAKATVNAKNDYSVTPLSLAAENGSVAMVQKLLKAGADVNITTETGETTLMTAVRVGSLPVVKALLAAGVKVDAKGGGRDETALMWAATRGQHDIMKALIAAKATIDLKSALRPEYVNFSRGNPQGGSLTGLADQTLESDGTRPGVRWINKGGYTAFLFATQSENEDLESVKILLAAGANINATTGIGNTALLMAIRNDHEEIAEYLVEHGADVNSDSAGHTALHMAVARQNTYMIEQLLAHKANPNARLTRGEPDPQAQRTFNQLPEWLSGATPFLLAAGLNDIDTMKKLVAAGADPKIPMLDGTTATMASMGLFPGVFTFSPFVKLEGRRAPSDNTAYFQRKRLFTESRVLETVKLTVELGVDINAARGKLTTFHIGNSRTLVGRDVGDTALHMATADKYPTVIEFLVNRGAKLDVKDQRGLTPLGIATSKNRQFITGGGGELIGNEAMAEKLRSLGAKE